MCNVVAVHDMWTFGAKLATGDVDDIINCFYLAKTTPHLTIYVTNDTGDGRRHKAFLTKYGHALTERCPEVKIVTGAINLSGTDKVILCAPLHPEHDAILLQQLLVYRPQCKYYAQGDQPNAYNMTGSALTPYIRFGENTLSVVDETGATHHVPITLYNTASTNRKFGLSQLHFVPDGVIHDMLVYGKHKLCFLPSLPYAIGLLMKKYGTGNTAYGLCHTMELMKLHDTRDPDEVISEYFSRQGSGRIEQLLAYPAIQAYIQTMKNTGKLDSVEDMNIFKRAMALVVECTIELFGVSALDRFRTLADDDVVARIHGYEKYSTSMFDLVVGVAAMHDLSPQELSELLPGTANSLAEGKFLEFL